jgi:hypothetical protein
VRRNALLGSDVRMSGRRPEAAARTEISERRYQPMKERSSLTIGWLVTGTEPTPGRPVDDACERRVVAGLGPMPSTEAALRPSLDLKMITAAQWTSRGVMWFFYKQFDSRMPRVLPLYIAIRTRDTSK